MKSSLFLTIFSCAVLQAAPVFAAIDPTSANGGTLENSDLKIITELSQGNMAQAAAGALVDERAMHPGVKKTGALLARDRARANAELKEIARSKGVIPPAMQDRRSASLVGKLASKEGEDFDNAFVDGLEKENRSEIRKFEDAARDAKDPELRAFAQKNLPILRQHQQQLQGLKN